MKIADRVAKLREEMQAKEIDAFIVNGMDPHAGEYVPDYWQTRRYISGFTGSYGHFVATQEAAALWTDSRYFVHAEEELAGTGITMEKDRVIDAVPYEEWILKHVPDGGSVAIDGSTLPVEEANRLEGIFSERGIRLITEYDLLDLIWTSRPPLPTSPVIELTGKYVGLSRKEKIEVIQKELKEKGANATVITALDDIAWVLNVRARDIQYNPVMLGYLWIETNKTTLFTAEERIPEAIATRLREDNIDILPYGAIVKTLEQKEGYDIWIDSSKINLMIYSAVVEKNHIINGYSIPTHLKSIKNSNEIAGMEQAHITDGVAMVTFLHWLDNTIGKEEVTELSISKKLKEIRSQQPDFFDISFPSIVSYAEHAGIIHYCVNEESSITVKPEGVVLIDSGGQYLCGTTDITRTIALAEPSKEITRDFTLVLKGMIRLSKIKFPQGTKGCHLDVVAREALWSYGFNYGHGTGHGVGFFLNVHEGPMSIRPDFNDIAIVPGHILSNEPGIYRNNEYGIRIENVIVTEKDGDYGFGEFNKFRTLTLCPIDRRLIDKTLMTEDEISWINDYHLEIYNKLNTLISSDIEPWLKEATAKL